jgi:hypothetical protein
MSDTYVEKRQEIEGLGLDAIKAFFGADLKDISPEFIHGLHQKARIGMQFEREMNVSKRAVELNYLRVFRLAAEDKQELKKYLRKALPQYLPEI